MFPVSSSLIFPWGRGCLGLPGRVSVIGLSAWGVGETAACPLGGVRFISAGVPALAYFSETPRAAENPRRSLSVTAVAFCENPGSGRKSPETDFGGVRPFLKNPPVRGKFQKVVFCDGGEFLRKMNSGDGGPISKNSLG